MATIFVPTAYEKEHLSFKVESLAVISSFVLLYHHMKYHFAHLVST